MVVTRRCALLFVLLAAIVATPAVASQQPPNAEAATVQDFLKRVNEYAVLHKQLEAKLPKLPKEATPQQIDADQRALERLVAQARATAKPGDLFTPAMQAVIHKRFNVIFRGTRGQQIKKYIHDEPHPVSPVINKRYPDEVPTSTMPIAVLAQLPKLPDELEYRFVANHLILMDVHAYVILDYVLDAIPATIPAGRG